MQNNTVGVRKQCLLETARRLGNNHVGDLVHDINKFSTREDRQRDGARTHRRDAVRVPLQTSAG